MQSSESERLLKELHFLCTRPEIMYSHHWRIGDLKMWDNCPAQHLAVQDYTLPQRQVRTVGSAA